MTEATRCPTCGSERPAGAVEGLCPQCLLGQALDLGAPSSAQRDPIGRLRPSKAPWSPRESAADCRPEAGDVSLGPRYARRLARHDPPRPPSRDRAGRAHPRGPSRLAGDARRRPGARGATSSWERSPGAAWAPF